MALLVTRLLLTRGLSYITADKRYTSHRYTLDIAIDIIKTVDYEVRAAPTIARPGTWMLRAIA